MLNEYNEKNMLNEVLLDEEISNLLSGMGFNINEIGTLFYKEVIKVATRYLIDLSNEGRSSEAIINLKGMVSNFKSNLFKCAYNAGCGILIYSDMIEKENNKYFNQSTIDFSNTDINTNVMDMHNEIIKTIPSNQKKVTKDNYWYMVSVFATYIFNKFTFTLNDEKVRERAK